jgi:putative redox protein
MDQPLAHGRGPGPEPTELFVFGLAACVGFHFYAERYLRRHSLGLTGLVIECGHDVSEDGPARVSDIRISVMAPGLPETRREPSLG